MKHPFVVHAGPNYLRTLHELGFKTFDGVIDESYDLIEDKHERWQKVLDSMLQLTKMNHIKVHNELASILIHNKEHFENIEWKRCLTWDSYQ